MPLRLTRSDVPTPDPGHVAGVGRCTFCNGQVHPERDYRKVTGWERRRGSGGTNAIALRQPLDVWACTHCVARARRNVHPGQGTL